MLNAQLGKTFAMPWAQKTGRIGTNPIIGIRARSVATSVARNTHMIQIQTTMHMYIMPHTSLDFILAHGV